MVSHRRGRGERPMSDSVLLSSLDEKVRSEKIADYARLVLEREQLCQRIVQVDLAIGTRGSSQSSRHPGAEAAQSGTIVLLRNNGGPMCLNCQSDHSSYPPSTNLR